MALFKGQWWLISHTNQSFDSLHLESSLGQVALAVKAFSSLMEDAKKYTKVSPMSLCSSDGEGDLFHISFLECTARILHECIVAISRFQECLSFIG